MSTNEELNEEGAEEAIEDLEAPADAQSDVGGGQGQGCGKPSLECLAPTCGVTAAFCYDKPATHEVIVYEE